MFHILEVRISNNKTIATVTVTVTNRSCTRKHSKIMVVCQASRDCVKVNLFTLIYTVSIIQPLVQRVDWHAMYDAKSVFCRA